MNQQTIDDLKGTLELLTKGWTRQCSARDLHGWGCSSRSIAACCWCLTGAVERATLDSLEASGADLSHETLLVRRRPVFSALNKALHGVSRSEVGVLEAWNDSVMRRQFEVLDLVKKAIQQETES